MVVGREFDGTVMPARTRTTLPRTKAKTPPKPSGPTRAKMKKLPVCIFVSYSHRDADARARLETHLAPLKRDNVETWFDGDMNAGDRLDTAIAKALRSAHIFVGLLSPDYLASNYCWKIEYRRAMNRRARGSIRVVAVVVRPCDWKSTVASGFKLLPEDGREVTRWRSADDAYLNIVRGIRRVVASVRKDIAENAPKPALKRASAPPKTRKAPAGRPTPGKQRQSAQGPGPVRGIARKGAKRTRT